jgi:chromosomal replication initiation ATPase DnaA
MKNKDKKISVEEAYLRLATTAAAIGFGVEVVNIMGRRRHERVAHARMTSYWLIRHGLGLSYEAIGAIFSKDHGTIMHGCNKVEEILEHDRRNTYNNNWCECVKKSHKYFVKLHKARANADINRKLKEVEDVILQIA